MKTVLTSSVIVKNNRRMLLLKKIGGSWPDHWSLPGGKVEPGESFEEAAIRELYEEIGISVVKNPLILLGSTSVVHANTHYLGNVYLLGVDRLDRAKNKEPGKHSLLSTFIQAKPPAKMIPSLDQFVRRYPNLWRADRTMYERLRSMQSPRMAGRFGPKEETPCI